MMGDERTQIQDRREKGLPLQNLVSGETYVDRLHHKAATEVGQPIRAYCGSTMIEVGQLIRRIAVVQ